MNVTWRDHVAAATACEFIWTGENGELGATVATPLLLDSTPALAFPYAHAEVARAAGTARAAVLVLSDPRMTGRHWQALAVSGTPRLVEDATGELFTEHLMDQELRKYPPSRTLADSMLLRREHWWYLPRLVVTLEPDGLTDVVAERQDGAGGVLGVRDAASGALRVASVTVNPDTGRLTPMAAGDGTDCPLPCQDGRTHPAVLLRHDFSVPDLERWPSTVDTGELTADRLATAAPLTELTLPGPLGLLTRLRNQHALSRGCRRALR